MTGYKFILESSSWLILICLLVAALYAFFLYYRDRLLPDLPPVLRKILPILRFLLAFIIAFLLLEPVISMFQNTESRPIIVVAQDNSSSILNGRDSSFYGNEYPKALENLINDLDDHYEVRSYHFSDVTEPGLPFDFSGKQTDISAVFDAVQNRYANMHLGAVILATDGNYNKGRNPYYDQRKISAPVYAIALGDTNPGRDMAITRVYHNRIAYLGNTFPVEVSVEASQCEACTSRLTIIQGGRTIAEETIRSDKDDFYQLLTFNLKAEKPGQARYTIKLSPVEGEISTINNESLFFIDVLDNRQKVLLVAKAPHPDVNAIRSSIAGQQAFDAEVKLLNEITGSLNEYSLLIGLHLNFGDRTEQLLLEKAEASGLPLWLIGGVQSRAGELPRNLSGMVIQANASRVAEVFPIINPTFSLFEISDATRRQALNFPPLSLAFGSYAATPVSEIFLKQKIGSVNTEYPLWNFQAHDGRKISFVAGEGLWRWKMTNYASSGNTNAFDEIIRKTVQYLSVKEDKSRFQIRHPESFPETERILIEGELYNESYELVNDPDVNLEITNEDGAKFSFSMARTQNAYRLDAGHLPPGLYKYRGGVRWQDEVLTDAGEFMVLPVNAESQVLAANHDFLYELTRNQGGEVYGPNELDALASSLKDRKDLKPIIRTQSNLYPIVSLWWLLLVILLLAGIEWFIRRRYGAY